MIARDPAHSPAPLVPARALPAAPLPKWLDTNLYPFVPRRFATPEGVLSYVDEGRGPVVVLVHGTPSWSFEWRAVITELVSTHRVIALDHLGFGLSDRAPADALTLEGHAARLRGLIEALDLRDVTLVVHDFGGPIGLALVCDGFDRITRVMAANTWMWPSDGDPTVARIDRFVRSWLGRILYLWFGFSARVLLPSAFGDKKRLTRAIHRQYLAPLGRRADREGTYAFARALRGGDPFYASLWARRTALEKIPLTLVWGEKDPLITTERRDRWIRAFPHARLVSVPDAGHFVAEERPDAFVDAIRTSAARDHVGAADVTRPEKLVDVARQVETEA